MSNFESMFGGGATAEKLGGKWLLLKNKLKDLKSINIEDFPSLTQFYNYYVKEDVGAHLVEKNKAEEVIKLQEELKTKENKEIDLNVAEKLFKAGLILEQDLLSYKNLIDTNKRLETNNAFGALSALIKPEKIEKAKEELLKKDLTYENTLIEDYNKKIEYLRSMNLGPLAFEEYLDLVAKTDKQFEASLNSKKG